MSSKTEAVVRAEDYYDSGSADEFYKNIWGGEDIHIGLYQSPDEAIAPASRRTVETMAKELQGIGPNSRVLDLGAGYGGVSALSRPNVRLQGRMFEYQRNAERP